MVFQSDRDGNWEIYKMRDDGYNQQRLTDNPAADISPAWSPDGGQIVFASSRDGNWKVYRMRDDGYLQKNLTENPADDIFPDWSPDGQEIVFASNRDGNWEVYRMRDDGYLQENLTENPADDIFPAWSPDGQEIVFASNRDGNWEVYKMRADGYSQRRLTNNETDDTSPAWSPDGQEIVFASNRDGVWEVYKMRNDGYLQENLTENEADDMCPAWRPYCESIFFQTNRDGNWEVYKMRDDGYSQQNLSGNWAGDMISPPEPALGPTPTATATPTPTSSPTKTPTVTLTPAEPPGDVNLSIVPSPKNVAVNEIFTVDIQVDAGSQLVDAVDVYLSFDRNYLRVVDASGNETNSIIPGSTLPLVLQNTADNSTGRITFSAGKQLGSPSPSGTFTLATIRFKAMAQTTGTTVAFLAGTDVFYQGDSVLDSTYDGTVTITNIPPFRGEVTLQGRGSAGDPRWENFPLTVTFYPPGGSTSVGTYNATTDSYGVFSVAGVGSGAYDVEVKNAHTLSTKRMNVTVPSGTDPLNFCTLLEGDANDDNRVAGADFSLLATNYGQQGPLSCSGTSAVLTVAEMAGTVDVSLQPPTKSVSIGEVFTMDIQVDAGSQLVDAVDAFLSFDRNYLRVVDASGNETNSIIPGSTLPLVLQNTADNSTGRITFSAGKQLGSPSPSGTFTLATIRFKAMAQTTGTTVAFLAGTDVFYQGDSVLDSTYDGTVTITNIPPFRGEVTLQGRGSAGDPRWENFPLTVTFYPPGGSTSVGTYNATTDSYGVFSVAGVGSGAYDVEVKNAHTLSTKRMNVTVPSGTDPLNFCTLLEGDANDDNRVAGADFSLLATNYGQQGPLQCSGASTVLSVVERAGTVDVSLQPPSESASIGKIFTLDIQIAARGQGVDAVDAYLSFDHHYLRVVDAGGNETNNITPGSTLPLVLQNTADNSAGLITYSAGKQLGSPSPSGTFVLATIRLRAIAEMPPDGTPITFLGSTHVFYEGNSVLGNLVNGDVVITSTP